MAMLTNAIRAQARAHSLSSRTRLSSVALTVSHSSPSICPQLWCSRQLSTSRPQLNYGGVGTQNFRRPPEPSATLWIGNVPFAADEADLREVFAPLAKINDIRVGMEPDGRSRGFAHIQFASVGDATKVIEHDAQDPIEIQGRDINMDYAPTRVKIIREPHHKLYIYEFTGTEEDLRDAFKDYERDLISVYLMKHPETGNSIMAGFIDFVSVEKATEALEAMNNREVGYGITLKLSYARKPRMDGRGPMRGAYGDKGVSGREGGGRGYRDGRSGGYRGGGYGGGYRQGGQGQGGGGEER